MTGTVRAGDATALLRSAHTVSGTAYAMAMTVVAAFAAWPIYADAHLLRVVAVSFALALLIAVASAVGRWRWWVSAPVTALALVVSGVVLVAPPAALGDVPGSSGQVVAGVVTGWKDLLSVDLPVGTYRNLLMPVCVVVLVGVLLVLRLSWRTTRSGAFAVVPALAMTMFGLLFGAGAVGPSLTVGPVTIPAVRELAVGAAGLVVSVAWLSWRGQAARRAALRHAAGVSGVRVASGGHGADARRMALAAVMTVAAIVVGAVLAPTLAEGRTRDVLRRGTDPATAISRAVTPLTDYRADFTDEAVREPLFTVTAQGGALPDRVRLATLTDYDGVVYRVGTGGGEFTRVPSRLKAAEEGTTTVTVHIDGLRGIWLPTVGTLDAVEFTGTDAQAASDRFYYDRATDAAVLVGGVHEGQTYRMSATETAPRPLAQLTPSGARPPVELPEKMRSWIDGQDAGTGGAGLARLVHLLRSRGHLSHALSVPDGGAAWTALLGEDYVFQPSAAGHSLARVDELFDQLLRRQEQVDAGDGSSLVAAVGDDEQFSVAVALIAQSLGFPSRVVVGARLHAATDDPQAASLPVCEAGTCTGADIAAWAEVRDASGTWVAVDATAQHEESADTALTRRRDPENPTVVRPDTAQEVVPPDPTRQESGDSGRDRDDHAGWDGFWPLVRASAIGLAGVLIVLGPFLVVPLAKRMRRRGRRRARTPRAAMVGGWQEYVDLAVDRGLIAPTDHTRTELARRFATPDGAALAAQADRAVFAATVVTEEDSRRYWDLVQAERHHFVSTATFRQRVRAAVSLRSFTRGTSPRAESAAADGAHRHPGEEGAPAGAHRA